MLAIDIKGKEKNSLTAANEYKTFRTLPGNLHTIQTIKVKLRNRWAGWTAERR